MKKRVIKKQDLERFMRNSINLALKIGYDKNILKLIKIITKIKLIKEFAPEGVWFGDFFIPDEIHAEIKVYYKNISTEEESFLIKNLEDLGIKEKKIKEILKTYNEIPRGTFYRIFNQSYMDFLIASIYDFFKNPHEKKSPKEMQIQFAKIRGKGKAGKYWKKFLKGILLIFRK